LPPASGLRERNLTWTFSDNVTQVHVSFVIFLISGIKRNDATSIEVLIFTGSSASKMKFRNNSTKETAIGFDNAQPFGYVTTKTRLTTWLKPVNVWYAIAYETLDDSAIRSDEERTFSWRTYPSEPFVQRELAD
jgi:hypothetical protein